MSETQEASQVPEKKVVSTKSVLADLDAGLDRRSIKDKYGLTHSEVNELFKHKTLAGKRAKQISRLEIVDDAGLSLTPQKTRKSKATETSTGTISTSVVKEAPAHHAEAEPKIDNTPGEGIKEVHTKEDEEGSQIETSKSMW